MRFLSSTAGFLTLVLSILPARMGGAQQFTDIAAGIIEPGSPCVAWGDYDNDGDLDLLVAGKASGIVSTVLYRNAGGSFIDSGIAFLGLEFASAAWGDYDGDGDLDLAMIGRDSSAVSATRVYRNEGGVLPSFVDIGGSFTDVVQGALAWADYDKDGDLDLIVTGITEASVGTPETRLYRNDGGSTFTSIGHPFPDVHLSAVAWGDYDNDTDLDLVIMGGAPSGVAGALFRNDGGVFVDAGAGLPAVQVGFTEWADYDGDGDLDLLLGGISITGRITKLYQNTAGVFADVGAGFPGLFLASADWGDYDNDGDLDVMMIGSEAVLRLTRLYRNDGGTFVNSGETFPNLRSGAVAWGDYDGDGDLDLVLGGDKAMAPVDFLRIYRNRLSPEIVSVSKEPGNAVRVIWSGAPGRTYRVDESSDLTAPSWVQKTTPTADAGGLFEILELVGPNPSPLRRYYRAVRQ